MPDINAQRIGISLCSICLHLALFGLFFSQGMNFENGAARKQDPFESTRPVVKVEIVPGGRAQPTFSSVESVKTIFPMDQEISSKVASASLISRTLDFPIEAEEAEPLLEPSLDKVAAQDYFPVGRLTRLPTPLVDIDLDIPAIYEAAFSGEMELSVLIDENGIVIDVLSAIETDILKAFSELVMERFKSARFTPGEIDGRAVKSQLQVTVVSENLPAMGN